jgi:hypothetical protein
VTVAPDGAARPEPVDPPGREVRLPSGVGVLRALVPLLVLAALAALHVADGPLVLRVPLAIGVVLFIPGTSAVGLLRLRAGAARAVLSIAVSLGTATLLAEGLVLADRLTATNALVGLVVATVPLCLARTWRAARAEPVTVRLPSLRFAAERRPDVALTVAALVLWAVAALLVDPTAAGDLGMVTALPLVWWAGLAALLVGLVLHVRRGTWAPLAVLQTAALVAFLFVTMTVSEPYSRIPTSYTHVGLVDYLVRDHQIIRHFDARFSWPGSLSLGAMLTQIAGATSSATFVRWAIPLFVALWATAVYAVVRCFASSARVRWLAVWLFLLLNWVGQDYYSPQATNFFFVLVTVAAVATWVPRRIVRARMRWLPFEQPPDVVATSGQLVGLVLLLVGLAAAVASSHQLSPFMLVGALTVLWIVDRRDIRLLPIIVLVLTLAWISWGAYDYWIGHFASITKDVGNVGGVVGAGTSKRLANGSAGHRTVLAVRLVVSIGAWLAGAAGYLVARRRTGSAITVAALAVAPAGAIALQSYGGELGLRIFLFSLPFTALLAAEGADHLLRRPWPDPRRAVAVASLAAVVLGSLFVVSRYGNEQFEQIYPEDMAAVRAVYDLAPVGSIVLGPNTANVFRMGPWKSYRAYRYVNLAAAETIDLGADMRSIAAHAEKPVPLSGFILITRAGIRDAELRQGARPGWDRALREQLSRMGGRELFHQGRASVWSYNVAGAPIS